MIKFNSLNSYNDVWITSDTHFNHKNICRGVTSWDISQHGGQDSVRDFDTLEQMNEAIIKGINDNVKENDILIHCGDWSFGGKRAIFDFWDSLVCKNIILIKGNHDHNITDKFLPQVFRRCNSRRIVDISESRSDWDDPVTAKELFTEVLDLGYFQWKGFKFMASHYPMIVWHQSHKDAALAFGHVHGSNPGLGKSQDVGIDVAKKLFGEYRPFNIQEFIEIVNKKDVHLESHHNKNTN